jgi:RecA-family ATPase
VTLANELMRLNELIGVGGLSCLVSLDDGLPQIPNVDSYLNILRNKAAPREITFAAAHLRESAVLEMDNPRKLIEEMRRKLDEIGGSSPDTSDSVLAEVSSIWKYEDTTTYLVEELIVEKAVTIWTGESGDGKSTLALAMAAAVAQGQTFLGRAVRQRTCNRSTCARLVEVCGFELTLDALAYYEIIYIFGFKTPITDFGQTDISD